MKKKVHIICPNYYALTGIRPLLKNLKKNYQTCLVYIPPERMDKRVTAKFLNIDENSIVDSFHHNKLWNLILSKLDFFFKICFTSKNFSTMFRKYLDDEKKGKYLKTLFSIFPKSSDPNTVYSFIFSKIVPNIFGSDPVLSFTQVRMPYWQCQKGANLHLIVDSWDHPVKSPFFLKPKKIYVWNKFLSQDVKEHQKIQDAETFYPLRFHYLKNIINGPQKKFENQNIARHVEELPSKYILYGFFSNFNYPQLFHGEMTFLRDLVKYAEAERTHLYIKPRPENGSNTFDEFKNNPWVKVGIHKIEVDNKKVLPDLILDDDYNLYRYILLNKATLFINVGTSLVFEAATVGLPILQLQLNHEHSEMQRFLAWSTNPHIVKYLNSHQECFHYQIGNFSSLKERLDYELKENYPNLKFSQYIKNWLWQEENFTQSFDKLLSNMELST